MEIAIKLRSILSQKNSFWLLLLTLIIATLMVPMRANSSSIGADERLINRLDSIEIGRFEKLSDIFGNFYKSACVLSPYQYKISFDSEMDSIVNGYLESTKYVPSEDHWAIILIKNTKIAITTVSRNKNLDMISQSEFQKMPINEKSKFTSSNCVEFKSGGFLKLIFRGRVYIVMGKKND